MTPAELASAVSWAVRCAVDAGELDVPVPPPGDVPVTVAPPGPARRPGDAPGTHADYGTGIALRLAGPAGRPPRDVAGALAARLDGAPIARVDVAGPGFLNVTLTPAARAALVRAARTAGDRWGHGSSLAGAPLDPPAPAGRDPRSAAVVRLLRACGADVPPPPPPGPPHPALGPDATAWAHTRPAPGDRPDLDPRTHLPQRPANPLFRVRYAHARVRALLRNAADLGFGPAEGDCPHPAGAALLAVVADWPRTVGAAAAHRAPDRVARALEAAADAVLDLHDAASPLPRGDAEPTPGHRSRLALAGAGGSVLACGLALLGVDAPDHL